MSSGPRPTELAQTFPGASGRRPLLTLDDARRVTRDVFCLDGRVDELGSTQEQNFLVDCEDRRYVLKVANTGFARAELELQNRAMSHAARELGSRVPTPVSTPGGADIVDVDAEGGPYLARLVTYLHGRPLLRRGEIDFDLLRRVGLLAGGVTAALADFHHPASVRTLQWDLRRAGDVVAGFAPVISDGARRSLVERTAESALAALGGVESALRVQTIHGDLGAWNILVEDDADGGIQEAGVIDFGDVVSSWLAADCATLVHSIVVVDPTMALQREAAAVGGFHARMPLLPDEVAALPALVALRAAVSAASFEQQALLDPDNTVVSEALGGVWRTLDIVAGTPPALASAAFHHACQMHARRPAWPRRFGLGRLIDDLEGRPVVPLDLSPTTELLNFGEWDDATAIAAKIREIARRALPIGRYAEARIVHDAAVASEEPHTIHLGVDVFLAEGTTVRAPFPCAIATAGRREMIITDEEGWGLRLAGVVPEHAAGIRVDAGTRLATVAPPDGPAKLPAHVHVQVMAAALGAAPGLAPPSLAEAWSELCPDPSPVLGLGPEVADARRAEDPVATLARRQQHVARAQPMYYPLQPPRFERGWRQWLYDSNACTYLDVINNVAVVGHSHPHIQAAAARQLRLLNTNSRFLYDSLGRLAERLTALCPHPLDSVFVVNSGSEANDLALRIVRELTGRDSIYCLGDTYHGWTEATNQLLVTSAPHPLKGAVRPGRVHALAQPRDFLANGMRGRDHVEETQRRIRGLEAQGRTAAAFVCEPLLGNAGGIALPEGYLPRVYAAIRARGGLCIADEVQVGYARTGRSFWAFEAQGVVPDIVTVAKSMGNGYPVAAVITTQAIAEEFAERTRVFSSTGGSPLACAVALAVLDVMEAEALQENAVRVGDRFAHRLRALGERHVSIAAVHGSGLFRGVELRNPQNPATPASALAARVCQRMLERGVVVQPTGAHHDVLKFKPPLCVTADDVDLFASILDDVLLMLH